MPFHGWKSDEPAFAHLGYRSPQLSLLRRAWKKPLSLMRTRFTV